jgi:hypothetical protein
MGPRRSERVRELYKVKQFVSKDDSEQEFNMEEEIEFEADDGGVVSTKENEEDEPMDI